MSDGSNMNAGEGVGRWRLAALAAALWVAASASACSDGSGPDETKTDSERVRSSDAGATDRTEERRTESAAGAGGDGAPVPPAEPERAPAPTGRLGFSPNATELVGRTLNYYEGRSTRRIYIQTDKPMYRPGEMVWVKSWILSARSFAGATGIEHAVYKLVDPKGQVVADKQVDARRGHARNQFAIESDMAGGRYTIRVRAGGVRTEREIIVANYDEPAIKKELEFLRKAYGPGDRVVATAELQRGTDEPLGDHPVDARVRIGSEVVQEHRVRTDSEGRASVEFELPTELERADGILTLVVETGGTRESISRRIPILRRGVDLEFYPEGGDLVEGLESRVYFDADKPNGKPADVAGEIVDGTGEVVAEFRSFKNGMGRFEFTPTPGESYRARLTKPADAGGPYELPDARPRGCVLRHFDDFDGQRAATRVAVRCRSARTVHVAGFLRGSALDVASVRVPADEPAIVHLTPDGSKRRWQGVARVTAFSRNLVPLAERLVYRRRRSRLAIEVEAERESYSIRDRVKLTVKTRSPDGEPVDARLAMSAVDDKVLKHADAEMPNLLSALHLVPNLRGDVEKPNFYFELDEKKAARALDLLMGTRGYRTFRWRRVLPNDGWGTRPEEPESLDAEKRRKLVETDEGGEKKAAAKLAVEEPAGEEAERLERKRNVRISQNAGLMKAFRKGQLENNGRSDRQAAGSDAIEALGNLQDEDGGGMGAEGFGGLGLEGEGRGGGGSSERGIGIGDLGGSAIQKAPEPEWSLTLPDSADEVVKEPRWARVREFPVPDYDGTPPDERVDFRDTVYWNPDIRTGPDGKATVEFALSDEVTSFRVTTEGLGAELAGRDETVVASTRPFSVQADVPDEWTAGDRAEIPVRLVNRREQAVTATVDVTAADGLEFVSGGSLSQSVRLKAGERDRIHVPVRASEATDEATLRIRAETSSSEDSVEKTVRVTPKGIPGRVARAGPLESSAVHTLEFPPRVEGTLEGRVKVYVNSVSSVVDAREGMLEKPHGCFEQTTSANHPNVMLLSYLQARGVGAPELVSRAKELMGEGYEKLRSYEIDGGGFSLWGKPPANPAITAYGLLQFADMREVGAQVEPGLLRRTAEWLLGLRSSEGRIRTPKDSTRLDSDVITAYAAYALSQTKWRDRLGPTADLERERAETSDDPYRLALAANTLGELDDAKASRARERLAELQDENGAWTEAETSITRSRGNNLRVETTALAVRALLRDDRYGQHVSRGVEWLHRQRRGGLWGSTQATVLTLKALSAYREKYGDAGADEGRVEVRVDDTLLSSATFSADRNEPLVFDWAEQVDGAEARVKLTRDEAEPPLTYSIVGSYRTREPESDARAPVRVETRYSEEAVATAETMRLSVDVSNATDRRVGMTLVRVGLPAGVEAQNWQLEKLPERGEVAFYERRPREVTLYLDELQPGASRTVPLELKGTVPGEYTAKPSQAYPYYNDSNVDWTRTKTLEVAR